MSRTLTDLLDVHFQVKSRTVEDTVSVGNSRPADQVVKNNPNRVGLTLVNISANGIYISSEADMLTTQGIYLVPNGGTVVLKWDTDFSIVGYDWYAIATGAASALNIIENVLY